MIPKTGNKLLDNVIIVALIVLVIYLLKKVFSIVNLITPTETTQTADPEEKPFTVEEDELTYPEGNYLGWADELDQLFSAGMTEDEEAIKSIFYKLRTTSDFAALVNAFGIRRGYLYIGSGNLFNYIAEYLSKEDRKDINTHNQRFGIKYRV